jgi:hypothetical protein
MYKVSLIVSSAVLLLVLGFMIFSYKPEGRLADNATNNSAAVVLSVPQQGGGIINEFKKIFAHPVDPSDSSDSIAQ